MGHPLVEVNVVKGDEKAGENHEYIQGQANMCIVFGCSPTRTTRVSDRVTHALFEYLEKKEK